MSRRGRLAIALPALAGLGALLVWGFAGLPSFGNYRGPYGPVLDRVVPPARHVANVVNGTTYDVRGVDTMGEEFILFAAVAGVVLLLRGEERDRAPDDELGVDVVRVGGVLSVALVVLVGLWLVAFGFVTPGGGFQGGAALASGGLMVYLASSHRAWRGIGSEHVLDPLEAFGAGGFVAVGTAALLAGLPFLGNVLGHGVFGTVWSGGSAGLVNWTAGIEVAAALLILYAEYVDEYVSPIARSR